MIYVGAAISRPQFIFAESKNNTRYTGVSFMKKILFDNNKNVISKKLKFLRVQNGLSQSQLAARMQTLGVNIDQQMISKIEHNTRFVTDYELACFCSILDVSIQEMMQDFYETYLA